MSSAHSAVPIGSEFVFSTTNVRSQTFSSSNCCQRSKCNSSSKHPSLPNRPTNGGFYKKDPSITCLQFSSGLSRVEKNHCENAKSYLYLQNIVNCNYRRRRAEMEPFDTITKVLLLNCSTKYKKMVSIHELIR